MVKYNQYLTYSLLATLAGLPVGCLIGGVAIGCYGVLAEQGNLGRFPDAFLFGGFVAMVAAFVGILPSFLYGAPVYALLSQRNRATVFTAAGVGLAPGIVALAFEPNMAVFILLFGGCVALTTHAVAKRRLAKLAGLCANNSSKPTPLRGAA